MPVNEGNTMIFINSFYSALVTKKAIPTGTAFPLLLIKNYFFGYQYAIEYMHNAIA